MGECGTVQTDAQGVGTGGVRAWIVNQDSLEVRISPALVKSNKTSKQTCPFQIWVALV